MNTPKRPAFRVRKCAFSKNGYVRYINQFYEHIKGEKFNEQQNILLCPRFYQRTEP